MMEEEVKKIGQKLVILLVICTFIGTIMIMLGGYSLLKRNNEEQTDNNESNQATDNTENVKTRENNTFVYWIYMFIANDKCRSC